ncbi:MAG: ABC transporter ATP-binding protein [Acidobacteriota bacterium]
MTPLIEMTDITKSFPGVVANDGINLKIMPGKIHALLGENGAGKTTLMNILAGMYQPDRGEIKLRNKTISLRSPNHALRSGIGMIYQHFMLVPSFTVAQNVVVGDERLPFIISKHKISALVRKIAERYGFDIDTEQKTGVLSIGQQQRVEILRALYRGSEVLILDEPTSVLTPQEVSELFAILRRMADEGKAIILITHKLNEVVAVADQVTVLRRGKVVGSAMAGETDENHLAQMMVGRDYFWKRTAEPAEPGPVVLSAQNLTIAGDEGTIAVRDSGLELRGGEITAIAGVAGNGQKELVEAIARMRSLEKGNIILLGKDISQMSAREVIEMGIRFIPEDRIGMGLVGNMGLADNLILRDYYTYAYGQGSTLDYQLINERARELVDRFEIAIPDFKQPVKMMSGGNLQRLLVAREISHNPKLIVAAYPSRGLDVAATEAVYGMLEDEKRKGCAVLLVMEDLEEIMRYADRVVVMFKGSISEPMITAEVDQEVLGLLMAGISDKH